MDKNSLRSLGIRIVILSRGRASSLPSNTCSLFPDYVDVVVPTSEVAEYEQNVKNNVIACPDSLNGLGDLRNWCLDSFNEEVLVMVDDDIRHLYCLTGEFSRRITDADELVEVIANAAVMCRDSGAKLFGFSQTDIRKYNGCEPFALGTWVGCVVGVVGRKLRFRSDPFKVDVDFTLQNLLVNRIVWVDTRYYFSQARDTNSGGCSIFRSQKKMDESLDSLKAKWGEAVKIRQHKGQVKINLNCPRRQCLTIGE